MYCVRILTIGQTIAYQSDWEYATKRDAIRAAKKLKGSLNYGDVIEVLKLSVTVVVHSTDRAASGRSVI